MRCRQSLDFEFASALRHRLCRRFQSTVTSDVVIRSLTVNRSESVCGYYVVQVSSEQLFVKVEPKGDLRALQLEDDLWRFLQHEGVPVPRRLPSLTGPHYDSFVCGNEHVQIKVSEYIEYESVKGSPDECVAFAKALSRLHLCLARCPLSEKIERRSSSVRVEAEHGLGFLKEVLLTRSYDSLFERSEWVQRNRGTLVRLVEEFDPSLRGNGLPSQVIHGDLHLGNLGWHNKEVVFLDLETMTQTFVPRIADVAKLVFSIRNIFSVDTGPFLRVYADEMEEDVWDVGQVCAMWTQLAYDNICRSLYACHRRQYVDPQDELDKFVGFLTVN